MWGGCLRYRMSSTYTCWSKVNPKQIYTWGLKSEAKHEFEVQPCTINQQISVWVSACMRVLHFSWQPFILCTSNLEAVLLGTYVYEVLSLKIFWWMVLILIMYNNFLFPKVAGSDTAPAPLRDPRATEQDVLNRHWITYVSNTNQPCFEQARSEWALH